MGSGPGPLARTTRSAKNTLRDFWLFSELTKAFASIEETAPEVRTLINENDQADRAISTGKLQALLLFHTRPINVVVFHGSDREYSF